MTISAKLLPFATHNVNMKNCTTREIYIVVFDSFQLLDATGPAQVLSSANDEAGDLDAAPYRIQMISHNGGLVSSSSSIEINTKGLPKPSAVRGGTLLIAGGPGARNGTAHAHLVNWLRRATTYAERACAVCTGAFLLAQTGVLNGERVVTHWRHAGDLQKQFPALEVSDNEIYIRSGKIYTSAGITSGIDLCLALVEQDLGRAIALATAKRLVVYMKRPGGQNQFSSALLAQTAESKTFSKLIDLMRLKAHINWDVERMASQMNMTPRTFHRKFTTELGCTPAKYLMSIRLEIACDLIENSHKPIKKIAQISGFVTEINLKNAFQMKLKITPKEYVERFRVSQNLQSKK